MYSNIYHFSIHEPFILNFLFNLLYSGDTECHMTPYDNMENLKGCHAWIYDGKQMSILQEHIEVIWFYYSSSILNK